MERSGQDAENIRKVEKVADDIRCMHKRCVCLLLFGYAACKNSGTMPLMISAFSTAKKF